jgi:hypothetical protein
MTHASSYYRKTIILGITLEEIPENWDRHFEEMLKKAGV